MNKTILQKLGILSVTLIAATFASGCVVATPPPQAAGNTGSAGALIWYVDIVNGSTYGDGRTPATAFNTIQAAATVAQAGDTVEVFNGTYMNGTGPVLNINTPGTSTGGYITYEPAPGNTPVIQVGPGAYSAVNFAATSAYIIFKGFTILGNAKSLTLAGAQAAAIIPTAPNSIIYNGNCIQGGGTNAAPTAIPAPAEPNHIKILNNTIGYCTGVGIGIGNADYLTISGNTVYNSSWYTIYGESGISVGDSYDAIIQDVPAPQYKTIVTNNILYGNEEFIPWVDAGKITDGEGIIIDTNGNNQYDTKLLYPPYAGRTLIANNVIYNDGSGAIELLQGAHFDVINNSTFNDNLNQATEPGRGELSMSYLTDAKIYNNIFYSSINGIPVSLTHAPLCGTTCIFDYNLYYGNSVVLSGYATTGAHDIIGVSPMYTSTPTPTLTGVNAPLPPDLINAPTGVNLMLLPGSPAIGKGTATVGPGGFAVPSTDILGKPRPSANGYTLGAYSQ